MKIKKMINLGVTFLLFATLVTGFQVEDTDNNNMNSILSVVGVEEAYAGPCGNRGCVGNQGICDEYVVLEIGGVVVTRTCYGTKNEVPEIPDL